MKFIRPNEVLAKEMIEAMSPHVESGHMLSQNIEEIMQSFESWFIGIGQDQSLTGFFRFRRPYENYAEIGSVLALQQNQRVGTKLLQKFELERKKEGQTHSCAITKNNSNFFINHTKGKLLETFPDWYQKSKDDKNFILWS